MSNDSPDHGEVESVTDRVHETSWSANLEGDAHALDRDLVVRQAIEAVTHTARGNHVNLVTHGDQGCPEAYLYDELESEVETELTVEYVDQCGCGGHVTRVHVH